MNIYDTIKEKQISILEISINELVKINLLDISNQYSMNDYTLNSKENFLYVFIDPPISISNAKAFVLKLKSLPESSKVLIFLTQSHSWLKPNVESDIKYIRLFTLLFKNSWKDVFNEYIISWEDNLDELIECFNKQFVNYCIINNNVEYVTYYNIYISEYLAKDKEAMPEHKIIHFLAFLSKLYNLIHNLNE